MAPFDNVSHQPTHYLVWYRWETDLLCSQMDEAQGEEEERLQDEPSPCYPAVIWN